MAILKMENFPIFSNFQNPENRKDIKKVDFPALEKSTSL